MGKLDLTESREYKEAEKWELKSGQMGTKKG